MLLKCVGKCVVLSWAVLMMVFASAAESVEASSGMWLLAKYDVNGDREISVNEIGKKRQKMFVHMDDDQDGSVSFDEYQVLDTKRRQLILKARFNKLDVDQNGHVDTQEYSSYLGSFERFDSNRDGRLTAKEMSKQDVPAMKVKKGGTHCLLWVCVRSNI